MTKRKQPSSHPLGLSAMSLCLLGLRVPMRLISIVCRTASTVRLGAMFMPMWMILLKSRKKETLLEDLKEAFDNLRVYKMMLNPAKCIFGVPTGKLLGFWCLTVALRLTRRKSRRLRLWLSRHASMTYNGWRVVLQL